MRIAILLLVATFSAAVEVTATITRVSDGDTIAVTLADGTDAKVRLLCVVTAESKNNSHGEAMPEGVAAGKFLAQMLPKGSVVVLWSPRPDALEKNRYDQLLAFVLMPEHKRIAVQELLIRSGWSVYWRKYGDAPQPYHDQLAAAMTTAKEAKAGAWSTAPDWMRDKSNERTAPKR